jgi:outer membrane protein
MNRSDVLLAALMVALPQAGRAAAGDRDAPATETARLSLAETIDRARAHSARLAQLSALESAADAALRGARANRLPTLDLGTSYTRNSNVPELTIALPRMDPRTIFPNIPDNFRARAGLGVALYTGGRVEGGITAAEHGRAAAARDVEGGVQDLVLEASTAYWQLVTSRESARVLAEAVASFEAHLKETRDRFDYGMAARNEVLAVQVQRDRAELNRLVAVNSAEIANANLIRLVGLSPNARVEPVEPLTVPEAEAPDVEALVPEALGTRSEIAALRSRIAAAEASVRVARSATLPQAGLSAGYDYARPNTRILPPTDEWKGSWSVGVNVTLTAFDGGRTAAAAAQARAQAESVRRQLEDAQRRVRLEVTSRVLDLGTARSGVAVAERNLEAAGENVRVSRDRYREGLVPSSELLDAETALLLAGLDRTSAATALHLAQAHLKRAVGR